MRSLIALSETPGYSRSSGRLRIETSVGTLSRPTLLRYSRSSGRLRIETVRMLAIPAPLLSYSRSSGRLRIETLKWFRTRGVIMVTAALRGG